MELGSFEASWDLEMARLDQSIRQAKRGDGRSKKMARRRLDKLEVMLELEKLVICAREAVQLKAFIERTVPVFRKSIAFDVWQDSLIYGRRIAIA